MLRTLLTAVAAAGACWIAYAKLKEQIMTSKDEVLAQIADVKTLLVETGKDVSRVADKLDQALANNDLTAVSEAVAELKTIAQGIDDRAEASDPEQPATGEPAEPEQPGV
ncbi:hypothetical protein [Dactylosporangium salmoneum]|uniref:Uncharacterized protein n=1 Tax=Dactylosporangium salmoneum TaxID=53361 RepID=A0ABP5T768_9ACTN